MKTNQSKLGLVLAGLLLSILMASMDNTIVATAMGTIVGELGGFDKFVWVTSAYMVAEMAGMPIFGKLSDMFGRKRFFIFGLIVFGYFLSHTLLSLKWCLRGEGARHQGSGTLNNPSEILDVGCFEKVTSLGKNF